MWKCHKCVWSVELWSVLLVKLCCLLTVIKAFATVLTSRCILTHSIACRDCNPGSRDPGNFPIPKSRDWAVLNPGISGLTKFIYLTVFLVLLKIILCIYSFFGAFLSPQWGGKEPSCWGGHTIVLTDWAVLRSWLQSFLHLPVYVIGYR